VKAIMQQEEMAWDPSHPLPGNEIGTVVNGNYRVLSNMRHYDHHLQKSTENLALEPVLHYQDKHGRGVEVCRKKIVKGPSQQFSLSPEKILSEPPNDPKNGLVYSHFGHGTHVHMKGRVKAPEHDKKPEEREDYFLGKHKRRIDPRSPPRLAEPGSNSSLNNYGAQSSVPSGI
jgi:hypothetical protein